MRAVRFAVIGAGYMARRHIAAIEKHPSAELALAVNRGRVVRGTSVVGLGPFREEAECLDALREHDCVDAIVLCTPDSMHPRHLSQLLPTRKVILCEKPLARSEQEFAELRERLRDSRVVIGMNCRFRSRIQALKAFVAESPDRKVAFVRAAYYSNVSAVLNGNLKRWWLDYPAGILPFLHGAAIHMIDALRFVVGEVESVSCVRVCPEKSRALDGVDFSIVLQFVGGAVAEVTVCGTSLAPSRFEIALEGRDFSIDADVVYRQNTDSSAPDRTSLPADDGHDLDRQLDHLVEVVAGRTDPMNSVHEAYRNFLVIRACEASVASGCRVAVHGARD